MARTKVSKEEYERVKTELKGLLKPGDTVFTKLNHVSRSGMSRDISLFIFRDNEPRLLDYDASILTGYPLSKNEGIRIGGCGMDMGFALVYDLSHCLYGDGYECIEGKEPNKRCPSNFHVNTRDKTLKEPIHKDGYALNHRWL